MVTNVLESWLEDVGLGRYQNAFSNISIDEFKALLMQDYAKFGVTSVEDKQKLFRLIKSINRVGYGSPEIAPEDRDGKGAQVMDLDAEDSGDLVSGPDDDTAMQVSPPAPGARLPEVDYRDMPKIRVIVRKRPLNTKERERGEEDVVDVDMRAGGLTVMETKVRVDLTKYQERHQFNFDCTLDAHVSNEEVYRATVLPLVNTLFHQGRSTVFAYGQTGSGKTFTMQPLPIRATRDILQRLSGLAEPGALELWVAYFEIYGGKVFDLLNGRQRIVIREDGKKNVNVVGLEEHCVVSVESVESLLEHGNAARSTGSTGANADSSRSHAIMQFTLRGSASAAGGRGPVVGKVSFIDLAGSERGADTFDNDRQTRLEGAEINKSLLALKECIRALDAAARHVPFRGSKLTEVLRDSFTGKYARTVMIANISPSSQSCEHTLNTLRYADRVKELRKDAQHRTPSLVTPGGESGPAVNNRAIQPPASQVDRERLNRRSANAAPGGNGNGNDRGSRTPDRVRTGTPPRSGPGSGNRTPPRSPMGGRSPVRGGGGGGGIPGDGLERDPKTQAYRPRTPTRGGGRPPVGGGVARGVVAGGHGHHHLGPPSGLAGGEENRGRGGERALRGPEPSNRSPLRERSGDRLRAVAASRKSQVQMLSRDPSPAHDLREAQEELAANILEEEDELISAHRQHIEETMDVVRREMNLLAEVDQPGSAIDSYVDRLAAILEEKNKSIVSLQRRLRGFSRKLMEEEELSRTAKMIKNQQVPQRA